MVGQDTSLQEREALREGRGLNDPFVVQFGRFVGKAVQGEFGISYRHRRPVEDLIAERLPATTFVGPALSLSGVALVNRRGRARPESG